MAFRSAVAKSGSAMENSEANEPATGFVGPRRRLCNSDKVAWHGTAVRGVSRPSSARFGASRPTVIGRDKAGLREEALPL